MITLGQRWPREKAVIPNIRDSRLILVLLASVWSRTNSSFILSTSARPPILLTNYSRLQSVLRYKMYYSSRDLTDLFAKLEGSGITLYYLFSHSSTSIPPNVSEDFIKETQTNLERSNILLIVSSLKEV